MNKNQIKTDKAPQAIGPYSQAIEVNGMVYTSGVIPVNPATGEIPEGTVAQANQALTNLKNLLEAAGTSLYILSGIVFPVLVKKIFVCILLCLI